MGGDESSSLRKTNVIPSLNNPSPPPKVTIKTPFFQRLKKVNNDAKFQNFLLVFKTLSISTPLVETLFKMLGYVKFMKELVTKKRNLEYETIEVSHNRTTIMSSNLVVKKDNLGGFTIPYMTSVFQFAKALCDLGASISLMPLAIFKQLRLGILNPTTMRLLMVDHSIIKLVWILYDVLVRMDKFIFPANLMILDSELDIEIPMILGRSFLAIGWSVGS